MPDEAGPYHSDIATQLRELLEKKRLKVGAQLVQTLEGDANAYFIAVDPTTGATGLYCHDQSLIDPGQTVGDEGALAPEAPRELVVSDDTAVPEMIAALQSIYVLTAPRFSKQVLAVMALLRVVSVASWPDPRAVRVVYDLLPQQGAKVYGDLLRGTVVASVAWLRAGEIENPAIEQWLDGQIKAREPRFVLGFTGKKAVRWFYRCTEKLPDKKDKYRPPPCTSDALKLFGPCPAQPVTRDQAIKAATELLDTVCLLNSMPLAQERRSGG